MTNSTNSTNSIIATVIFDNGGSITLQLQQTDSFDSWAHCYDDPRVAATALKTAFVEGFGQFDGHSDDADGLDPDADQIRNGSYSVVRFASRDEAAEWAESITCDNSWGENMTGFAAELVRELPLPSEINDNRFSRHSFGGGERGETLAHEALVAHEATLVLGARVRQYRRGSVVGTITDLTAEQGRSVIVTEHETGLRHIVETHNLELA